MILRNTHLNTSRVLRLIFLNQGISRVEIARTLHLDKSSVTLIVNRLLDMGIIKETRLGQAGVRGGRRPVSLAIEGAYGAVLGMELQSRCCRWVLLDLEGRILDSGTHERLIAADNLLEVFLSLVHQARQDLARRGMPLLGVGVGLSGVVDYHQGVIKHSIPLQVREPVALLEEVDDILDVPVFLDNDANCVGWGELAFHKPRLLSDFICVLLRRWQRDEIPEGSASVGLGLGVVFHGKVYHGRGYSAGEFRSLLWQPGRRGQFSLKDSELDRLEDSPKLFERFGRELAAHLALLVNTFNFQQVTLSGAFAESFECLSEWIREATEKNWPYDGPVNCEILVSAMGLDAVAYGAAGMVLERIFEHPEVPDGRQSQIPHGLHILMNR